MSRARAFDLVVFDLDGTLVDSAPDIAWALNAALAEAGLPVLAINVVLKFVGDGAAKLIERALASAGSNADPQRLLERYVAHYEGHVCVGSRLFPGVTDLLATVANMGMQAAVLTNKLRPLAAALLEKLGIADRFPFVIADGDGFPRKPDPTAARWLLNQVGIDAERAVVVGDGLADVGMAHLVPCRAIAAAWGYVPRALLEAESPAFVAASPADVTQFLCGDLSAPGGASVTPAR